MAALTAALLKDYEGYSMRDICPHGFDSTRENHCAHFVSHVLQLDFGATCTRLVGRRGAIGGANVRVQEVFGRCPATREVLECPTAGIGLIFVSAKRNFRGKPTRLRNVPKKHIGIGIDGIIWHYSNTRNEVVRQPFSRFLFHFPRQENALWWGKPPPSSMPTWFGTTGG